MGEEFAFPGLSFNGSLRVEARPERLTSEAGAVIIREVIERLGIVSFLTDRLHDSRSPLLITHPLSELITTSLVLLAQGWRDQDDADVLRKDGVLRMAVSDRRGVSPLADSPNDPDKPRNRNPAVPDGLPSQPTLSRLHAMLSMEANRRVLRDGLVELAARRVRAMNKGKRLQYATIDLDSLPVEVEGHQPGSEHNGHYHARIYHPLVASLAETGDLLDLQLREGAVHTAEGALEFLEPLIDKVEQCLCRVASVRMDAGFPEEKTLAGLERRRTAYVARIKNNPVLDRRAQPMLKRPPGRPPTEPRTWFYEEMYQAQSWSRERRVVLVVQERPGELFAHYFWLITSWTPSQKPAEDLLDLYRERGTAEGYMGELMSVLEPALSSSPRPKDHYRNEVPVRRYKSGDSFAINEVRLLLNAMAYNVMHVARTLLEAATHEGWSLRRVRERVLRVAARLLLHGRRATLVIAQSAATLWAALWSKLRTLRVAES